VQPKRVSLKLFVAPDPSAPVALGPFVPLFHRFIQRGSVEGLLVDVADYAHVPQGPGILLIGHEVDYGIDLARGRAGLLVVCKRGGERPLGEVLRDALRKAWLAAQAIEDDGGTGVRFERRRFELRVLDRLAAPNRADAFEALVKEVEPVLRELFGDDGLALERAGADDSREPLGLAASVAACDGPALVQRLGGAQLRAPVSAREAPQSEWDIAVEDLERLRDLAADLVIVDVREEEEYAEQNLGGTLIPLGALPQRLAELDPSAHVIVHCKTGTRGARAVKLLRDAGFGNAWNVRGGLDAWIERIDPDLAGS
jgi:rhodanese-related sulfurtransferase